MSGAAVLAAGLAALAVGLLWRPGDAGLARLRAERQRPGPTALPGLSRGAPTRSRLVVGALVAAAAVLLPVAAFGWPWPVLLTVPPLAVGVAALLARLPEPADVERRRRLVLEVPAALDLMAAALAAGRPVRAACADVVRVWDGPVAEDLGRVLRAIELGTPEADAWAGLAGHPQLGGVARDLARAVEAGTDLVGTLGRHAEAARAARRSALETSARAVGVRSVVPLVVCFLPAFLLLGVVPSLVSGLMGVLR